MNTLENKRLEVTVHTQINCRKSTYRRQDNGYKQSRHEKPQLDNENKKRTENTKSES